jgi:hypothetical protein
MGKNLRHFKEGTNLSLSIDICSILAGDSEKHGFVKNGQSNVSGFLNRLIPSLSHYREDLHERFLRFNGGDEGKALLAERNIYGVYLRTFDLLDDGTMNVPFRVNSKSRQEFIYIHDKLLARFDMDFTNYVRTLLIDYCGRPAYARELLLDYDMTREIKDAIESRCVCRFHLGGSDDCLFVPLLIERKGDENLVEGVTEDKATVLLFQLSRLTGLTGLDNKICLSEKECDEIYGKIRDLQNKEEAKCSDQRR